MAWPAPPQTIPDLSSLLALGGASPLGFGLPAGIGAAIPGRDLRADQASAMTPAERQAAMAQNAARANAATHERELASVAPFTTPVGSAYRGPDDAQSQRQWAEYMTRPVGSWVETALANDLPFQRQLATLRNTPTQQAALLGAQTELARQVGFGGSPGQIQNQANITNYQTSRDRLGDSIISGLANTGQLTTEALTNLQSVLPNVGNILSGIGRQLTPPTSMPGAAPVAAGNPLPPPPTAIQNLLLTNFRRAASQSGAQRQPGPGDENWTITNPTETITEFVTRLPEEAFSRENIPQTMRFMVDRFGSTATNNWAAQSRLGRFFGGARSSAIQRIEDAANRHTPGVVGQRPYPWSSQR